MLNDENCNKTCGADFDGDVIFEFPSHYFLGKGVDMRNVHVYKNNGTIVFGYLLTNYLNETIEVRDVAGCTRVGKLVKVDSTELGMYIVIVGSDGLRYTLSLSKVAEFAVEVDEIENNNYETDDKMVSHPPHYQSATGLEVIDVIEAFTDDLKGIEATDTGNVIKYICRWKQKNGLQDLKKAQWYLTHLINHVEKESN